MFLARSCLAVVAALLVPALASAEPRSRKVTRTARVQKTGSSPSMPHACLKSPVEVVAGSESATFALEKCDGSLAPLAVDELSILARPGGAAKPKQSLDALSRIRGAEVAPGIRRVDAGLLERLETVADHFRKGTETPRVLLVSGYRPRSARSFHSSARALDFRIDGVDNEALVAFCKTLPDTGCGYYPNSVFVHMDARNPGSGHIAWIDASRPGEAPKYVSEWPPRADARADGLPSLPAEDEAHVRSAGISPEADTGTIGAARARKDQRFFF
jgi:hypothetical protein